ncbi:unnamed protein product [Mytilus coruscus]|uniref:Uncharacterized protein n=1 Tax=Mytilus coruscus TaxID=42192 RepID=A0A6J8AUW0_MYTCO|nr:unnamed protein product [Mytilus coruscus]
MAVTLGQAKQTLLVDVEKDKTTKTIELYHRCGGVASDGQLVVISSEEKSTLVNLSNMSLSFLEAVRASRISLFKGNIYGTSISGSKVCCYNITGAPLWTKLDLHGFIYVASHTTCSILKVSPNGKTGMIILSEADKIKYPWAIDINKETGMMIVSSCTPDDNGESDKRDGIEGLDNGSYNTAFIYEI